MQPIASRHYLQPSRSHSDAGQKSAPPGAVDAQVLRKEARHHHPQAVDRMFNGDTLSCRGWLTYRKAGRAGLVFAEAGGSCNADDSWHDHGYEDEMVGSKSP